MKGEVHWDHCDPPGHCCYCHCKAGAGTRRVKEPVRVPWPEHRAVRFASPALVTAVAFSPYAPDRRWKMSLPRRCVISIQIHVNSTGVHKNIHLFKSISGF